jgi:hypothetical protein
LRSNGLAFGDGSRPNEGSRSNGLTSGDGLKVNDQVFFLTSSQIFVYLPRVHNQ